MSETRLLMVKFLSHGREYMHAFGLTTHGEGTHRSESSVPG